MKWWTVIALWFGLSFLSAVVFHILMEGRDMDGGIFDEDDDADL
jgi:hypothetical protein